MAVLHKYFWRVDAQHRNIPSHYRSMPYSEKEHALLAYDLAQRESPKLFYKVSFHTMERDFRKAHSSREVF